MPLIAEHDPLRTLLDASPPRAAGLAPAPRSAFGHLSVGVLADVVSYGLAAGRRQWLTAPGEPPEVMACVFARSVARLPGGLYEWSDGFRPLDGGQAEQGLVAAFGPAEAFIMVCGNIGTASDSLGARLYGQALVRAGAVGQHALRAAAFHGIAARACPESCYQAVRALESERGGMWRPLFTLALNGDR